MDVKCQGTYHRATNICGAWRYEEAIGLAVPFFSGMAFVLIGNVNSDVTKRGKNIVRAVSKGGKTSPRTGANSTCKISLLDEAGVFV
jgi:hypothetical protein